MAFTATASVGLGIACPMWLRCGHRYSLRAWPPFCNREFSSAGTRSQVQFPVHPLRSIWWLKPLTKLGHLRRLGPAATIGSVASIRWSFEGVWCDVLLWLQKDPDSNAKDLLAKLREAYPGRFSDAHLRTLQRRVKDWRGVMAKRLVYPTSDEPASERSEKVELVLVGMGNKG